MNILIKGNKRLRDISKELSLKEILEKDFQKFLLDLELEMIKFDGVGLASPQVGILKRVFVARFPLDDEDMNKGFEPTQFFINPRILAISREKAKFEEGCLSIPGFFAPVERFVAIEATWYDERGKKHKEFLEGFKAVIFQHENDHLDGILFTDYLDDKSMMKI